MSELTSDLYETCAETMDALSAANNAFTERYPGDRAARQPVHTVYGGAHLFKAETAQKLGELALRSYDTYARSPEELAEALGLSGGPGLDRARLAKTVHERVRAKLEREAVEDFRIDFEDGFGNRPDAEEDETAVRAAKELARGHKEGILPPFFGIRIKPLNEELKRRSVRTLDLFVSTLARELGEIPEGFVVTLPKIPVPEQVSALVRLFEALESRLGLKAGSLKMELMIELTHSLMDHEGRSNLPLLLEAAEGRCTGAHFGTYDYTACCAITAAHQRMDHPVCRHALHLMKVAYANTGVFLSDGATNVMPVPPHRAPAGGSLSEAQEAENRAVVHGAWRLAYEHIRGSLVEGFYQGWDLHPAQLPIRYAACYAFFLEGFEPAAERLRNFIEKAAQATLVGDVFDDAATGQGLLNYFLRALNSGAVSLEELEVTGLTEEEIRGRSFLKILEGRKQRG